MQYSSSFSVITITYSLLCYCSFTRNKYFHQVKILNQRIERLWRDVFSGCISLFYGLFFTLEENGILSWEDDAHIWCLHYVFLPIINEHLCSWRDAWIHHPIRTENNKTPFQLWVTGLEHARTTGANRIIEPLQVGTSAERNFRSLAISPISFKTKCLNYKYKRN